MQLRHLRTFVAVARTLSFSRGAERVHLSQSSVSEQIQSLESDLGASLFDRSRRRLVLTPAGERLLEHALDLLRLADEVAASVRGAAEAVSGPLRIGALETLCAVRLPGLLAQFQQRHPGVQVSLASADSRGLRHAVATGELDLAFLYGEQEATTELDGETVAHEPMVVLVPARHRLASAAGVDAADLRGEGFLLTAEGCVYRGMYERAFAGMADAPRRLGEYASLGAIRGLVDAGIGCAFVPASGALPSASGVALAWTGADRAAIGMLWRRRGVPSPAVAALQAMARETLRGQTNR